MTSQNTAYPRITALIETFADWLKHRRELAEIRQLDSAEFDRIAADLEISPGDLDQLVHHGLHAADELPLMLNALGIDLAKLEKTQPRVLHDMQRVCALCKHKAQCDRDLIAGTSAAHYEGYCPNAATLGVIEKDVTA
jgi:hypothetical protein